MRKISFCSVLACSGTLWLSLNCSAQDKKTAPAGMVFIRGGSVTLGIDSSDIPHFQSVFQIDRAELFADEVPKHAVKLKPFYLDRFLVTNAQFFAFTRAHPRWQPPHNENYLKHWVNGDVPEELRNHPVTNITWYDAFAYCQWQRKRLPTEGDWEHAARGGENGLFPWGDAPADSSRANFSASGFKTTTEVGKYPPNGYGLYDMAGNLWQFTADEWGPYSAKPTKNSKTNKGSSSSGFDFLSVTTRRVIRGGSWGGPPVNMWVEYRDSHPPDGAQPFVGFRCAKSVE